MGDRRMTRRRKAAFVLIPFLVFLTGIEVALRIAPGVLAESRRGEPGAVTILCIGDSVTWGWGERPEVAWPRLLQSRLRHFGWMEASAVSLARSGAGAEAISELALPYLREHVGIEMIAVVMLGHNDFVRRPVTLGNAFRPPGSGPPPQVDARGYETKGPRLLRVLSWVVLNLRGTSLGDEIGVATQEHFSTAVDMLRNEVGEVYLATYPLPGRPSDDMGAAQKQAIDDTIRLQGAANAVIRNVAATRGLALIDLEREAQLGARFDEAYFLDNIHLTRLGHDRVAQIVAGHLLSTRAARKGSAR